MDRFYLKEIPLPYGEALKELVDENRTFAEQFQLNLIGVVSENITKTIEDFGLSDYVNLVGYVTHDEAINAQMSSRVLLTS